MRIRHEMQPYFELVLLHGLGKSWKGFHRSQLPERFLVERLILGDPVVMEVSAISEGSGQNSAVFLL